MGYGGKNGANTIQFPHGRAPLARAKRLTENLRMDLPEAYSFGMLLANKPIPSPLRADTRAEMLFCPR